MLARLKEAIADARKLKNPCRRNRKRDFDGKAIIKSGGRSSAVEPRPASSLHETPSSWLRLDERYPQPRGLKEIAQRFSAG
jgi:hypothetical protein